MFVDQEDQEDVLVRIVVLEAEEGELKLSKGDCSNRRWDLGTFLGSER